MGLSSSLSIAALKIRARFCLTLPFCIPIHLNRRLNLLCIEKAYNEEVNNLDG